MAKKIIKAIILLGYFSLAIWQICVGVWRYIYGYKFEGIDWNSQPGHFQSGPGNIEAFYYAAYNILILTILFVMVGGVWLIILIMTEYNPPQTREASSPYEETLTGFHSPGGD